MDGLPMTSWGVVGGAGPWCHGPERRAQLGGRSVLGDRLHLGRGGQRRQPGAQRVGCAGELGGEHVAPALLEHGELGAVDVGRTGTGRRPSTARSPGPAGPGRSWSSGTSAGGCRSRIGRISTRPPSSTTVPRPRRWSRSPTPQARPMAATAHRLAAVVRFRTLLPWRKMTPGTEEADADHHVRRHPGHVGLDRRVGPQLVELQEPERGDHAEQRGADGHGDVGAAGRPAGRWPPARRRRRPPSTVAASRRTTTSTSSAKLVLAQITAPSVPRSAPPVTAVRVGSGPGSEHAGRSVRREERTSSERDPIEAGSEAAELRRQQQDEAAGVWGAAARPRAGRGPCSAGSWARHRRGAGLPLAAIPVDARWARIVVVAARVRGRRHRRGRLLRRLPELEGGPTTAHTLTSRTSCSSSPGEHVAEPADLGGRGDVEVEQAVVVAPPVEQGRPSRRARPGRRSAGSSSTAAGPGGPPSRRSRASPAG